VVGLKSDIPQRLKPDVDFIGVIGTTEVVPVTKPALIEFFAACEAVFCYKNTLNEFSRQLQGPCRVTKPALIEAAKMRCWPQKNTMESGTVDLSEKQQSHVKKTYRDPRIGTKGSDAGGRRLGRTDAAGCGAGNGREPDGTGTVERRARSAG
jgi:hypothetical protein